MIIKSKKRDASLIMKNEQFSYLEVEVVALLSLSFFVFLTADL